MELLEGIYTRRSVRHYTGQPVERERLIEIIKAGPLSVASTNSVYFTLYVHVRARISLRSLH